MITPPRRSVTRFFIPLIDVLILLFCIFLLMPFVSVPAADDETKPAPKAPELPTDVAQLQKQLAATQKERDEAQKRLDRFQKERGERLVVRVLEIDPDTGKLYYYAPGKQEVATQAQAEMLIAYQKRLAGEKDTYFLIMYPRQPGRFPTPPTIKTFRSWFDGRVDYGFDIP